MTSGVGMNLWLDRQRTAFDGLLGRDVVSWDGVEMALRDESPSGPQFSDPDVRFLQLAWVRLVSNEEAHTISTYQDDGRFGLSLTDVGRPSAEDCYGIFRWRALELPTGRIDAVRVVVEEGTLAQVGLSIGGHEMVLVAGEVYEAAGRLEVHRLDESVLLFADAADAATVRWM